MLFLRFELLAQEETEHICSSIEFAIKRTNYLNWTYVWNFREFYISHHFLKSKTSTNCIIKLPI